MSASPFATSAALAPLSFGRTTAPPRPVRPAPPTAGADSKVPRKDKSLAVLCGNFMELFRDAPPGDESAVIDICRVAERLGVTRRRIYDIINILESIRIVSRVKKNTYAWHGKEGLSRHFAELQREGVWEIWDQRRRAAEGAGPVGGGAGGLEAARPPPQAPPPRPQPRPQAGAIAKQPKGMAKTCRKFIQIFLVSGRTEFELSDAVERVLGPLSPAQQSNAQRATKTQAKRLYDIANVLQSLSILARENAGSTNPQSRPSFRWVYEVLPRDMARHLAPGTGAAAPSEPAMPRTDAANTESIVPEHTDSGGGPAAVAARGWHRV